MRLDNENALEVFSALVRAAGMDPKTPKGTRPGIHLAEIGAALAYTGDRIGSDMVLAIATQDFRRRNAIEGHLEMFVFREAERRRRKADWGCVAAGVVDAFEDVMQGLPQPNGASVYYRWARSEFWGRAVNTAIVACRRLFREVA